MPICFVHNTALDFWRWKASTLSSLECPKPVRTLHPPTEAVDAMEAFMASAHFRRTDDSVFLLAKSSAGIHSGNGIQYLFCSQQLPPYAFSKLNDDVYVANPQFTFLTLARTYNLVELALIGCELTGQYSMHRGEAGFSKCEPLTRVAGIKRTLDSCCGHKGIKRAQRAARLIVENSASPMETNTALILSLPKIIGGYGLPKPMLNCKLPLSSSMQMELKRESIIVDAIWKKAKLALEYESTTWHSGDKKFVQDSKRRNDIRYLGYDVTTITADEYKSIASMHRIATDIARKLGISLHIERMNMDAHSNLRRQLRQWGKPGDDAL